MNCKLFTDWFQNRFVSSVKRVCRDRDIEDKVLLLIDNAPSHPSSAFLSSEDGMLKTVFLPANTTSVIQPMDQGVLGPLKRRYKHKLLLHIIMENENPDSSLPELLKMVTMKDVVYWISDAWNEASSDSLAKAWKQLLPETPTTPESSEISTQDDEGSNDEMEMTAALGQDIQDTVAEWLDSDLADPGHQITDDEEIVADTLKTNNDEESDEEEGIEESTVTPHEAFRALDTSLSRLESQGAAPAHLLIVKKWHDTAARKRQESLRQTNIHFFKFFLIFIYLINLFYN